MQGEMLTPPNSRPARARAPNTLLVRRAATARCMAMVVGRGCSPRSRTTRTTKATRGERKEMASKTTTTAAATTTKMVMMTIVTIVTTMTMPTVMIMAMATATAMTTLVTTKKLRQTVITTTTAALAMTMPSSLLFSSSPVERCPNYQLPEDQRGSGCLRLRLMNNDQTCAHMPWMPAVPSEVAHLESGCRIWDWDEAATKTAALVVVGVRCCALFCAAPCAPVPPRGRPTPPRTRGAKRRGIRVLG